MENSPRSATSGIDGTQPIPDKLHLHAAQQITSDVRKAVLKATDVTEFRKGRFVVPDALAVIFSDVLAFPDADYSADARKIGWSPALDAFKRRLSDKLTIPTSHAYPLVSSGICVAALEILVAEICKLYGWRAPRGTVNPNARALAIYLSRPGAMILPAHVCASASPAKMRACLHHEELHLQLGKSSAAQIATLETSSAGLRTVAEKLSFSALISSQGLRDTWKLEVNTITVPSKKDLWSYFVAHHPGLADPSFYEEFWVQYGTDIEGIEDVRQFGATEHLSAAIKMLVNQTPELPAFRDTHQDLIGVTEKSKGIVSAAARRAMIEAEADQKALSKLKLIRA